MFDLVRDLEPAPLYACGVVGGIPPSILCYCKSVIPSYITSKLSYNSGDGGCNDK